MIRVTFRAQDDVYWAVCKSLRYIRGSGYLLNNILEDSTGGGPHPWAKTPESWQIMTVEEV